METYTKYIGKIFDQRYRIEKVIGLGGMAVVFMATDLSYGRKVAVKMLREDMALDITNVKRFENESKAVVLLEHDNIVKIYDVNVEGELKYFVMEYLEGITLKDYIKKKGKLDSDEVISCAEQILRALEHAHSKGVIHRDIKPQNVMLLKNGQIKVTDFGIAKLPSAETVTMEDKAIGTVYYISPEQASGKKVDSRTDIYSLGALLYEITTGTLPFDGDNSVSIALKHIKEDPIAPRELDKRIPEGLDQLIVKAMKRPLDERFQTASEMLSLTMKLKRNPQSNLRLKKKVNHTSTKERGGTSMFPIILGASCAFVVALAVSLFHLINVFLVAPSNNEDEFKVSNYVSMFYSETLQAELSELFTKVNVEYEYSDVYESGFILEQSVAPDLIRKLKGSDITLTVSIGREQMKMPDLRYYSLNEAISTINNLNFDLKIAQVKREDDAIEAGYLITTDPAANAIISKGDTVTLVVSTGEVIEYVQVPNLVYDTQKKNRTEDQAYKLLEDAGLKVGKVTRIQSVDHPEGTVLDQSIPVGERVPAGVTSIDLVVSGGLGGEITGGYMYMIDVKATALDAAITKLKSFNFDLIIRTEYVASNEYPVGIVVSADPEQGTRLSRGAEVTLYVSSGAASLVKVPDIRGMSIDEARKAITDAKLKVGSIAYQYSSTIPKDKVSSQSFEANSEIAEGTAVNIFISRGPQSAQTEAVTGTSSPTTQAPDTTAQSPSVTASADTN